jgi:hypothetical protein
MYLIQVIDVDQDVPIYSREFKVEDELDLSPNTNEPVGYTYSIVDFYSLLSEIQKVLSNAPNAENLILTAIDGEEILLDAEAKDIPVFDFLSKLEGYFWEPYFEED